MTETETAQQSTEFGVGTALRPAQSRIGSTAEALANVICGYLLAVLLQRLLYPAFGIETALWTDAVIAAAFTVISFARSYLLRRLFERLTKV